MPVVLNPSPAAALPGVHVDGSPALGTM